MQNWLVYGIMAALFWGSYIVAAKIATSEKYFGLNPFQASIFMLIGIAIVFVGNILYQGVTMPKSREGIAFSILAGMLWALGMTASFIALAKGTDIARLVPIYNLNTLVAVILGVLLLNELPTIKTLAGAVMIVIGAILVSL